MGLNDDFDGVRSQILLMDPLPEVTRAFSMVIQHERQHEVIYPSESQSSVNLAEGKKFVGKGKSNWGTRHCNHCGKSGHTIDTCFKKHSFPP